MHKILSISILLFSALFCSKQKTHTVGTVTLQEGISLYSKPSKESKRLSTIPFGSKIDLYRENIPNVEKLPSSYWYETYYSGLKGWVFGEAIIFAEQCPCRFTKEIIGSVYHNKCIYPFSTEYLGGTLISDSHAFSMLKVKSEFITLFELSLKHGESEPCWYILDTLKINEHSLPQGYKVEGMDCKHKESNDSNVVSIVKFDYVDGINNYILQSWEADKGTGKFIKLDSRKVECIPQCYGDICD
ncbi:SH3 domain-containing protein [Leptospira venezuelensis]|uniref:SH3 domain-containing protein n=1 Tax=Leptospira venezuelensis TaxID=1958811 RepID=UPI000A367372|nr:SH3 domain-containing protein [Leptospira venezuelensis]